MKASAYVGRIGALAVMLGVGGAVLAGGGTAWADTGSAADNSHTESATSRGPARTVGSARAGSGHEDADASRATRAEARKLAGAHQRATRETPR